MFDCDHQTPQVAACLSIRLWGKRWVQIGHGSSRLGESGTEPAQEAACSSIRDLRTDRAQYCPVNKSLSWLTLGISRHTAGSSWCRWWWRWWWCCCRRISPVSSSLSGAQTALSAWRDCDVSAVSPWLAVEAPSLRSSCVCVAELAGTRPDVGGGRSPCWSLRPPPRQALLASLSVGLTGWAVSAAWSSPLLPLLLLHPRPRSVESVVASPGMAGTSPPQEEAGRLRECGTSSLASHSRHLRWQSGWCEPSRRPRSGMWWSRWWFRPADHRRYSGECQGGGSSARKERKHPGGVCEASRDDWRNHPGDPGMDREMDRGQRRMFWRDRRDPRDGSEPICRNPLTVSGLRHFSSWNNNNDLSWSNKC